MTQRRNILRIGTAALVGAVLAPAIPAEANGADADLLAAVADFMGHQALVTATADGSLFLTEDEHGELGAAWYAALERVTDITPQTAKGRAAKLKVAYAALASTVGVSGDCLEREEQCALVTLGELLGVPA